MTMYNDELLLEIVKDVKPFSIQQWEVIAELYFVHSKELKKRKPEMVRRHYKTIVKKGKNAAQTTTKGKDQSLLEKRKFQEDDDDDDDDDLVSLPDESDKLSNASDKVLTGRDSLLNTQKRAKVEQLLPLPSRIEIPQKQQQSNSDKADMNGQLRSTSIDSYPQVASPPVNSVLHSFSSKLNANPAQMNTTSSLQTKGSSAISSSVDKYGLPYSYASLAKKDPTSTNINPPIVSSKNLKPVTNGLRPFETSISPLVSEIPANKDKLAFVSASSARPSTTLTDTTLPIKSSQSTTFGAPVTRSDPIESKSEQEQSKLSTQSYLVNNQLNRSDLLAAINQQQNIPSGNESQSNKDRLSSLASTTLSNSFLPSARSMTATTIGDTPSSFQSTYLNQSVSSSLGVNTESKTENQSKPLTQAPATNNQINQSDLLAAVIQQNIYLMSLIEEQMARQNKAVAPVLSVGAPPAPSLPGMSFAPPNPFLNPIMQQPQQIPAQPQNLFWQLLNEADQKRQLPAQNNVLQLLQEQQTPQQQMTMNPNAANVQNPVQLPNKKLLNELLQQQQQQQSFGKTNSNATSNNVSNNSNSQIDVNKLLASLQQQQQQQQQHQQQPTPQPPQLPTGNPSIDQMLLAQLLNLPNNNNNRNNNNNIAPHTNQYGSNSNVNGNNGTNNNNNNNKTNLNQSNFMNMNMNQLASIFNNNNTNNNTSNIDNTSNNNNNMNMNNMNNNNNFFHNQNNAGSSLQSSTGPNSTTLAELSRLLGLNNNTNNNNHNSNN